MSYFLDYVGVFPVLFKKLKNNLCLILIISGIKKCLPGVTPQFDKKIILVFF